MKFEGRESAVLDFKSTIPSKKQIINTVIGFCNLHGGKIIIGVQDNGEITGINEEKVSEITETLHRAIVSSCTPTIIPFIYVQRMGEKIVLIVEVSAGMSKPYFRSSEGLVNGTYLRMGPETVKANPEMVREIQWEAQGHFLDEIPVRRASKEDLNLELFEEFLSEKERIVSKQNIQDLLVQHRIITEEHRQQFPSVAGLLLFGKEPQKFLTETYIICSHFRGTSGRDAIATQDCRGTLFLQIDQAIYFIESRLNRSFTIKDTKRKELSEIPKVAIREVIINAVAHRNYQLPGPIKIAIYDDRVEVFSPGNFPRPIPRNQLEAGISLARNTVICQFFRYAKLVERLGSGWITLFSSYRKENLPEPEVKEGSGFVKVILPRPTASQEEKNLSYEEQIIILLKRQSSITAKEVIELLRISRQTASRILSKLVDEGKVIRTGKGRTTQYRLY